MKIVLGVVYFCAIFCNASSSKLARHSRFDRFTHILRVIVLIVGDTIVFQADAALEFLNYSHRCAFFLGYIIKMNSMWSDTLLQELI